MARRKRSYWDWILPAAAGATTEYFSKDFPAADEWGSYGEAIKAGLPAVAGLATSYARGDRGTTGALRGLASGWAGGAGSQALRRYQSGPAREKTRTQDLNLILGKNWKKGLTTWAPKEKIELIKHLYSSRNPTGGDSGFGLGTAAKVALPFAVYAWSREELEREKEEAKKKPKHIKEVEFRKYKTAEIDLRDEYGPNADDNPDFNKKLARLRVKYGLGLEPLEPLDIMAAKGGYIKKYRFGGSSSDAYAGESTRQEIIDEILNEGGEPTEPEILRRLELMGLADPDRYARHMRAMADSDIGKFLPNESAAPPVYTSTNKSKQRFPVVGSTRRSVLTKRVGPKKGPEYKPTLDDMIGAFRSSGILAHRGGSVSDLSAQSGLGSLYNDNSIGMISGPGGPTSDDIPAMLSDGEFVMTADAVNGAGGPEVMYELMDRFEGRA